MMRIGIDRGRCEGHGQCEAAAPRVLRLDDNAVPVLNFDGEVPLYLEEDARAAVSCCPVAALYAEGE